MGHGEEAVPTTSPGLMKRVQEARDHLLPFLTSRREEVPEPLRGHCQLICTGAIPERGRGGPPLLSFKQPWLGP
jgi:hypothetical protein